MDVSQAWLAVGPPGEPASSDLFLIQWDRLRAPPESGLPVASGTSASRRRRGPLLAYAIHLQDLKLIIRQAQIGLLVDARQPRNSIGHDRPGLSSLSCPSSHPYAVSRSWRVPTLFALTSLLMVCVRSDLRFLSLAAARHRLVRHLLGQSGPRPSSPWRSPMMSSSSPYGRPRVRVVRRGGPALWSWRSPSWRARQRLAAAGEANLDGRANADLARARSLRPRGRAPPPKRRTRPRARSWPT